jgi:hypothetical protein
MALALLTHFLDRHSSGVRLVHILVTMAAGVSARRSTCLDVLFVRHIVACLSQLVH